MTTKFLSPNRSFWGRIQNIATNAIWFKRLRRRIMAHLPFTVLASDVRNVVYANWIVPSELVSDLVPTGVEILDVDGETIVTVLTYAHGHFGPAMAGPLRRLFPSPLQSNWRLYVTKIKGNAPPKPTILFLANVFNSSLYAVGTRLFSDVMISHRAEHFEHQTGEGIWKSRASGKGSAPSWELAGQDAPNAILTPAFKKFFRDYSDALRFLCLQETAIAPLEDENRLAVAEIDLPIDIATVAPLTVDTYKPGHFLESAGATNLPFCFRIPTVHFRALSERIITITGNH